MPFVTWIIKIQTDIRVQIEDQKSKAVSHWLLPLPHSEMANGDPASRDLRMRLCIGAVSSHLIFLSRAGIKGIYHYHPVSMAN